MPEQTMLDQTIATIRSMLEITAANPKWISRNRSICVQYEFPGEDGARSYVTRIDRDQWELIEGAAPDDECDVIVTASAETLYGILHGELGGREAMVSGRMDLRKAPSVRNLLLMRAMFNMYTKSVLRAEKPALRAEAATPR